LTERIERLNRVDDAAQGEQTENAGQQDRRHVGREYF
jgi:hypothetical protein